MQSALKIIGGREWWRSTCISAPRALEAEHLLSQPLDLFSLELAPSGVRAMLRFRTSHEAYQHSKVSTWRIIKERLGAKRGLHFSGRTD